MEQCKYRQITNITAQGGVDEFDRLTTSETGIAGIIFIGTSRQDWSQGLCTLLTANDFDPVACYQPEHSERTCPDIEHLRS